MSNRATNGDYDASISSRGDNLKQAAAQGSASSPLTDLETAEVLQSIRNWTNDTKADTDANNTDTNAEPSAAVLPADLALSLDLHHQQEQQQQDQASYYWDASTMAPLNLVSAAAIARLRAYKPPPFPTWDRLSATRRAAVLILLFADRRGDLRVVITMRAASLRNFSGHAAFPGGKADSLNESPYQIARREAWEEIGLPMDDRKMPSPFRIEPLCCLPCSLAKTELVVRPCVAFLHADEQPGQPPAPTVDEAMIPRLDAKEVAAVFSAPFSNFLRSTDEPPRPGDPPLPPGHWYDGRWIKWQEDPWRVHNFYVPVHDQRVTKPKVRANGQAALVDVLEEEEVQRFLVWGMTGRILVDAARIAYGREPEFEHNSNYGDEKLIVDLENQGKLLGEKKTGVGLEATKEEVKDAKM
ncbi:NUDIX hydrolase domain-like protein [Xylariaceae sp. AK1471]|nr:NUDIX hydrolase domain-like protein [Xylariaceae sp. AK1471]